MWTGIWLIGLAALFAGLLGVLMPLRLAALGAGAVAIGAIFLVSAAGEAAMSSIGGRLADRRGSAFPVALALALAAAVTAILPWPGDARVLALLVVVSSGVFGLVWAPAMALISDQAEANGLEPSLAFAFAGIAFAAGQVVGAAAGGSLSQAVGQVIPYSVIAALCLATLAGSFGNRWRRRYGLS